MSLRVLLKDQLKFINQYYEVIAVSSDGDGFEQMLEEQGVRGVKINMTRKVTPFKDLLAILKLIILFRKEKPDIVHAMTFKAGFLAMIAAWIARVPVRFYSICGLAEFSWHNHHLVNLVEKTSCFCATKIYPNSHNLYKILLKNNLLNPDKAKVLANGSTNGIDTEYFSPTQVIGERERIRTKFNISDEGFVFCFVGRLVPDKGINELINAFVDLSKTNSQIQLMLIGPYEKNIYSLQPQIEEIILTHHGIHSCGYQEDIRPYLSAADAFVFPSYREGFPNVVMQAGAMGLAAIVSDINGCNEIIIEGVNGTIVPTKDTKALSSAMKYFCNNRDSVVKNLASSARKMIIERYNRRIIWDELLKEYNKVFL